MSPTYRSRATVKSKSPKITTVIVVGRASSPVGFSPKQQVRRIQRTTGLQTANEKTDFTDFSFFQSNHFLRRNRPHSRSGANATMPPPYLTGLRGQSASLFDKFPSRRPHNIKKLCFSKALLRMMINPRGEHASQYLGLFQVLTFAFCN
jgi:hypothetical protein